MDKDAYILAMWLRFLLAPKKPEPDLDGSFDLGEVGAVREKNWSKATPYSIACTETTACARPRFSTISTHA